MLNFGNKEFRNLEEQVAKNQEDISRLKAGIKPEKTITWEQLPSYTIEANVGKYYLVTRTGYTATHLYYITYNNGGSVTAQGLGEYPAVGPKGDTGNKGATGDKGDKGDRGLQGLRGIQGPAGTGWNTLTEIDSTPYNPTFTYNNNETVITTSADLKESGGTSKQINLKLEIPALVERLKNACEVDNAGSVSFGHDVYADGELEAGTDVVVGRNLYVDDITKIQDTNGNQIVKNYVYDNISIKTLPSATDLDTVIIGTTYKSGLYLSRVNFGTLPSFISADNDTYLLELEGFTPGGGTLVVTCTQTITMGKNIAWRTYDYTTSTWTAWTEKDLSKINTNQSKLLVVGTDYTISYTDTTAMKIDFVKSYKKIVLFAANTTEKPFGTIVAYTQAYTPTGSQLFQNIIPEQGLLYQDNYTQLIYNIDDGGDLTLDTMSCATNGIYGARNMNKSIIPAVGNVSIKSIIIGANGGTIPQTGTTFIIYGVEA